MGIAHEGTSWLVVVNLRAGKDSQSTNKIALTYNNITTPNSLTSRISQSGALISALISSINYPDKHKVWHVCVLRRQQSRCIVRFVALCARCFISRETHRLLILVSVFFKFEAQTEVLCRVSHISLWFCSRRRLSIHIFVLNTICRRRNISEGTEGPSCGR